MSKKLSLFDTLAGPVLNIGSQIWGSHKAPDIEAVHTKSLGRILCVKRSANLSALNGETGRLPMECTRKINMLKY